MKRIVLLLLVGIFLVGLVRAEIEVDENGTFIDRDYSAGDFIRGQLRMEFSGIDGREMFQSNLEGGISLIDLLEEEGYMVGEDYTCSPSSCEIGYSTGISQGLEDVEFDLNQKKTYGFKLIGEDVFIEYLDFEIFSGAPTSCKNQIFVDFFDDGEIDFFNTHYRDIACGERDFGCFNEDGVSGSPSGIPHEQTRWLCEKVTLPPAPAYRVGAKVGGTGSGEVTVGLFSQEDSAPACSGGRHGGSQVPSGGEIDVIVPCQLTEEFEGLVCVAAKNANDGYTINIDRGSNACGVKLEIFGQPVDVGVDYEIFAQPLAFDEFGWLDAASNYVNLTGQNLTDAADEYILDKYNRSCEGDCYIPFSFWRGDNTDLGLFQTVRMRTTTEKLLEYQTFDSNIDEKKIFGLFEGGFTVDSVNFTTFDIEKMEFEVPREEGEKDFIMTLDGEELIDEEIDIEVSFEFNVVPRFALIGKSTVFRATSEEEIVSSVWNFGDGSAVVISDDADASHAYAEEGEYIVDVEVTNDEDATSSRKVKVIVGDPQNSADVLLKEYEARISGLKVDIAEFPEWNSLELEKGVGLDVLGPGVIGARNDFESSNTDEEFIEVINKLLQLNVPSSVFVGEIGEIPGDFGFSNIDIRHVAQISGESVNDAENIKAGILAWMDRNYDFNVGFETVVKRDDIGESVILRKYSIDLEQKSGSDRDFSFLIIDNPEAETRFSKNYDVRETTSGASYIQINGNGEPSLIEFSISGTSPPTVEGLGIYISPALEDLGIVDKPYGGFRNDEGGFLWGRFLIAMGLLLLAFLAVYVILQTWYKRYYEKHLFKNPNSLYNLINFIYNSRRAGLEDSEIRKKLKGMKWSNEQISYAFNKIDGKRTGMWEIPIFKFVENRKVKKEIEKRQGRPADTRFIKRPVVY